MPFRTWPEAGEYDKAGDEVTFHLRPELTFSDGTPVNATAVKAAIDRAKTQKDSALFGDLTSIKSVTTSGDLDVVVHLTQVDYQIPLLLGERVLQIASPRAAPIPRSWTRVGRGRPFIVTQLIRAPRRVLEKNPDYWDAKDIHIDNVELVSAPDASTVVSGLQTGVYNFADIAPSQAKALRQPGSTCSFQPASTRATFSLNINKKPSTTPRSRRLSATRPTGRSSSTRSTFGYGQATDNRFPPGYVATTRVEQPLPVRPGDGEAVAGRGRLPAGADQAQPSSYVRRSGRRDRHPRRKRRRGITSSIRSTRTGRRRSSQGPDVSRVRHDGRDSALQTLTAHFGPNGPLNLSTPYEPAEVRGRGREGAPDTVGAPGYADALQAATRVGLGQPGPGLHLLAAEPVRQEASRSRRFANAGHVDLDRRTIGK